MKVVKLMSMEIITNNEQETIELGYKLGKLLNCGDTIILNGDLASGKTTFTKGVGKALNIKQIINSPTFTILKIYEGDKTLYHIDAYRLAESDYDLGLDENDDGIMIVEWPEYYINYLPKDYLIVSLKYIDDNHRKITFDYKGDKYKDFIERLK